MSVQATTETQSIEIDAEPDELFAILSDPRRLPEWAAPFADAVRPAGGADWLVRKATELFPIRLAADARTGCVDYLRPVGPGRHAGVYIRVSPAPFGGSVVVMTLPVPPGRDRQTVSTVLKAELAALARLAQAAVPESVTA